MDYIKKLSKFIVPYKRYAILNIICNVFYALFSTLAMLSLMPMINVLFGESEKICEKPIYRGLEELKDYAENSLNYFVTTTTDVHGPQRALLYMIILIISSLLTTRIQCLLYS